MSAASAPRSSLTSGVRRTVPAIRSRASSMSASEMGRTGSIIYAPAFTAKLHAACASIGTRLAISAAWACDRGAVDHALLDALDDAREAEQIVGEIPVELARDRNARTLANSARRSPRATGCRAPARSSPPSAGAAVRRHHPLHREIGEIGDRIAERRQLPVEHRGQRPVAVEHDIVDAIVAVDDRGPRLLGQRFAEGRRSAAPSRADNRSANRDTGASSASPAARNNCPACRSRRARRLPGRCCAGRPACRPAARTSGRASPGRTRAARRSRRAGPAATSIT